MQEGPRRDAPLQGLDGYEQMVGTFAKQAKAFWRSWGPVGEPMVQGIEACLGTDATRLPAVD